MKSNVAFPNRRGEVHVNILTIGPLSPGAPRAPGIPGGPYKQISFFKKTFLFVRIKAWLTN